MADQVKFGILDFSQLLIVTGNFDKNAVSQSSCRAGEAHFLFQKPCFLASVKPKCDSQNFQFVESFKNIHVKTLLD